MKPRIIFRLDGASFLGYGHIYQSLSLARAFLKRKCAVAFVMKDYEPQVFNYVKGKGIRVFSIPYGVDEDEELNRLRELSKYFKAEIVIIDHHDIDYDYIAALRKEGLFVVSIDDEGKRRFCSDILVNYNIYAPDIRYSVEPHTQLLLGPKYAILREQFKNLPSKNRYIRKHLLVMMGGGYARGEVIKVLEALLLLEPPTLQGLKPYVVLGPGYPNPREVITKYSRGPITICYNVENIREPMERAVFAISGAGQTLYELASMGVPSIAIILDKNQVMNAEYFHKAGIAQNLGWYEDVTTEMITRSIQVWLHHPRRLETIRQQVEKLIDGLGAERIVNITLLLLADKNIKAGMQ